MITDLEHIYTAMTELTRKHNVRPNKLYLPYGECRHEILYQLSRERDHINPIAAFSGIEIFGMEAVEQCDFMPKDQAVLWWETGEMYHMVGPNKLTSHNTIIFEPILTWQKEKDEKSTH